MNRFLGIVFFLALVVPSVAVAQTTPPTATGEAPAKKVEGESTQGQYVPLTGIPFITQDLTSEGCRDGGNPEECQTNLGTVFQGLIIFLIGVGGILAVAYFMWGAIQYMTQDIPSMKQNGREKMLGSVGGLVAVLAAFTLLQTIAPGIQTSIANFNEFLRPVQTPDCLGTEQGCLKPQEEGSIARNDAGGNGESDDTAPTNPLNAAHEETVLHAGDVYFSTVAAGDTKADVLRAKERQQDWCNEQKEKDAMAEGKSNYYINTMKNVRIAVAAKPDSDISYLDILYMCSKALEVKMTLNTTDAADKGDTGAQLKGLEYMLKYSGAVKDFKAKCEADQMHRFKPLDPKLYKVAGAKPDGTGGSQVTSVKGEMGYKELASELYGGQSTQKVITHAYFYCKL